MQPATVRAHPKPHSHQYPGPRTPVAANPKPYTPRHPEQTLLYRTVAENFETWLELASAGELHHPSLVLVFQPVTLASDRDDMGVMQQPIQ